MRLKGRSLTLVSDRLVQRYWTGHNISHLESKEIRNEKHIHGFKSRGIAPKLIDERAWMMRGELAASGPAVGKRCVHTYFLFWQVLTYT